MSLRGMFREFSDRMMSKRLVKQEAQIEALGALLAALADDDALSEAGRDRKVRDAVKSLSLLAANNETEVQRVASLYESLALRVAALEQREAERGKSQ